MTDKNFVPRIDGNGAESARMGLEVGQADPGWWLLCLLERAGLVHNVGLPLNVSEKPELVPAPSRVEAAA